MSLFKFRKLALTSTIASILLAACGGGGSSVSVPSSTILSGTVAGGAAIIGTVLVTDSKGATKGVTIEANGRYLIDVSGMTGPFVLKAAGKLGNTSVTYYSAATVADLGGTVNVTPFTNLIVSNIAAQIAETYFSNPDNIAKIGTLITQARLDAAQTALKAKLQPVLTAMGISESIDLLRTSFAANQSGIDAVLDLVKVEMNTATNIATLKNALTKAVLAIDNASSSTDDATPVNSDNIAGINPTAATNLQAVVTKLNALAALFATSLPSITTLQNAGVFDTTSSFMMGGKTFAQFATEFSLEQNAIGLKFSNVAIALDDGSNSGTLVAVISSNTSTFSETIELKVVKVSGVWLVQGDGRIADMSINARAQRDEWTDYSSPGLLSTRSSMSNGIHIWIDPHAYNTNNPGALAVSALVTGPGLPTGGVAMVQDVQNTWLKLAGSQYSNNLIPECVAPAATQCVTIAGALDNSEYTVVLKNSAGISLNGLGYKLILPKQPYATSTLTAAMFPTIPSFTIDGVAITSSTLQSALMAGGKSVNVTWTLPSGILSKYINIWANTTTGASYFKVEKDLLPTATSALIGLGDPLTTGTVSNAGVSLEGVDTFGRRLAASKSVSIRNQ